MGIITRMLFKLVPQEKIDSLIKEVIEAKFSDVRMQDQIQLSIRAIAHTEINELNLEEAVSSKWSFKEIAASVTDVLDKGLLAEEVAERFTASDIANEIDAGDIAYEMGASEVAENIDLGDLAGNIDLDDLADKITEKITEKRMKDIDMSQINYEQLAISLMSTIKLLSTIKELKEKVSK
jgi:hypothetical protein